MTTETLVTGLDTVAEIRLSRLFDHIRSEIMDARWKHGGFQIILDAKFTEDGRLVGEACLDFKHRIDTQNG